MVHAACAQVVRNDAGRVGKRDEGKSLVRHLLFTRESCLSSSRLYFIMSYLSVLVCRYQPPGLLAAGLLIACFQPYLLVKYFIDAYMLNVINMRVECPIGVPHIPVR